MTWSYSGDPSSSPKDQARFEVGDTNPQDPQLQDEEIQFLLTKFGDDVLRASASCCDKLVAKYSRDADKSALKTSIRASQRAEAYTRLARQLRQRAIGMSEPIAGGLDSPPIFNKGMMDS